jgi:hypothetical protein
LFLLQEKNLMLFHFKVFLEKLKVFIFFFFNILIWF